METLRPLVAFLYLSIVSARNNWNVPCLDGECWYDIPAHTPSSFGGTLVISGPPDAISDVTPAAGWVILDCDKNLSQQRIRIVCADEENMDNCDHLFTNGAKNKIVRLPESCGPAPFARVARASISFNQSLPSELVRRTVRRDGSSVVVHDITIDSNFRAADPARKGEIAFVVVGANERGFPADSVIQSSISVRKSRIVREEIDFAAQAFKSWKDWKKSGSKTFPLFNVDKTFTLFDESISCPLADGSGLSFSAKVKADIHGTARFSLDMGYAASGTLVPPKVKDFALFGNLDADLDGKFEIAGSASATLDSGLFTLVEIRADELNIPDILSIGPVFKLQGESKATLDINAQMSVDLSYSARSATIYWPPSRGYPSMGVFTPTSSADPKLFIPPLYSARASIEAHLIPRLEFEISAFKNRVKSTICILLDASATTALTLSPGTTQSPSRCVDVVAGLDVHGGADADFYGLFDKSTFLPIYQRSYNIFKKCFNQASVQRENIIQAKLEPRSQSLVCPSGKPPVLVSVTDL